MVRTEEEIYDQIDEALDNNGKFWGMSYEDGVVQALRWVLEEDEVKPMGD